MEESIARTIEKGTLWSSGANILVKIVAITNTLLVLTHLTVYAYGVAELALSIVGVMSIFTLPGIDRTIVADMGVEKGSGSMGKARRLFLDFVWLQLAFGLLAFSALFFGSAFMAHWYTAEIGSYFKIIAFLFLIGPFGMSIRVLFSVYYDFVGQSMYTMLQEVCKLAALSVFIGFGALNIAGLLWSMVAAQVLSVVILSPRVLAWYRRLAVAPAEGVFAPWSILFHHGKWTLFSSYLDTFGKNVRLWLIKALLGTEAVALFSVAQGIIGNLVSLLQVSTVIVPVLPQYLHDKTQLFRIIDKAIKYQLLGTLALIGVSLVLMPEFLRLVFPKYLPALPIFYVLVFSLIPTSVSGIFQTLFYALKAQKNLFFALSFKLCAIVALTPLFILWFGLPGAGIEVLVTTIFFGLERYRVLRRLLPGFRLSLRDVFRFDEYDRILLRRIAGRLVRSGRA